MGEQSFFGEIGVLFSVPRTATCIASKRSIILTLTKDKLKNLLEGYPDVAKEIALIAEERFSSFVKGKDAEIHYEFGEELSLGISKDDLKNVPIFRECEVGFLHMLALSLQPVQYHQGDLVIKKGDIANEMYFIVRGSAEVFSEEDGQVYAELSPPSFFGEVGIFFQVARTASVRVSSAVMDVFQLTKNNLDEVLKQYPEVSQKIKAEAQIRYQYNEARKKAKLNKEQVVETEVDVVREKLKMVPLFQKCTIGFLHQLALTMKLHNIEKDQIIIKKGERANSMFFVISGIVQVESDDGTKIYAEMGQNSFFGEVALFYSISRTANIRTKTQCTIMELYKEDLVKTLKQYPNIETHMRAIAEENYKLFLKREEEIKDANKKTGQEIDNSVYDVEIIGSYLEKIPLFKKCTKTFLNTLSTRTSVAAFKKNEVIIKRGDNSDEMFLIISGKVQVVSEDGTKTFDTMKAGSFFGEVGMLNNSARTATITSATDVELIVLSKKDYYQVVKQYPECHKIVLLEAEKRLKNVQKREEKNIKKNRKSLKKENNLKESSTKSLKKLKGSNENIKTNKFSLNKIFGSFKRKVNPINNSSTLKFQLVKAHKNSPYSSFYNIDEVKKVRNITDFNYGYFINILRFLPVRDWYMLSCVCKKWNYVLKNPIFWTNVDFSSLYHHLTHETIANALTYCSSTTDLNFHSCWRITNDDILIICEMCPHLVSLSISNCWSISDQGVAYIAQKCTNLLNLNISYCGQVRGTCFQDHLMNSLICLDISYCKQIGNECLEQLLTHAPELQEIKFRRCTKITDFGIFLVARHCRHIRNLDLSDCDQITNKCLKWLSNNSINLRLLDLTFCRHITNSGIYDLSLGCQEFESLNFSHCSYLSDTAILCLHKNILKLKRLSLRSCPKITDRIALHLIENCPILEWIDLTCCPNITIASKNKLKEKLPNIVVLMSQPNTNGGHQFVATEVPNNIFHSTLFIKDPSLCSLESVTSSVEAFPKINPLLLNNKKINNGVESMKKKKSVSSITSVQSKKVSRENSSVLENNTRSVELSQ